MWISIKIAEREYPPWETFLSEADKRNWLKWVVESYQNATKFFTFSDNTSNSVINDYGIGEEKVVTVYERANIKELPIREYCQN